jgi:diguanylate cyclase (GGDEF)-like protein
LLGFIGWNLLITFEGNRRLRSYIRRMAVTDALTGLANRRQLSHALANPPRVPSAAVIVMDVDRFKQYNDELGHLAGDQLLVRLARTIEEEFPDAMMNARFGGDEFVVLLPCRTMAEAEARVRGFRSGGQYGPVAVSVGVALWPDGQPTLDSAFAAADDCLRAAKQSGRNAYACWAPDGQIQLRPF